MNAKEMPREEKQEFGHLYQIFPNNTVFQETKSDISLFPQSLQISSNSVSLHQWVRRGCVPWCRRGFGSLSDIETLCYVVTTWLCWVYNIQLSVLNNVLYFQSDGEFVRNSSHGYSVFGICIGCLCCLTCCWCFYSVNHS